MNIMNKRLSDGDGGGSKPTFGAPSGLGSAGGFGAAKPGGFGGGLAFGSAAPAAAAPVAPGGGAAAAAPAGAAPDLNSTGLLPKVSIPNSPVAAVVMPPETTEGEVSGERSWG